MPFAKLKFLTAVTCGAIALGSLSTVIGVSASNLPDDPKPADKTERIADAAAQARSANNLKQIMTAMFNYYDSNQSFPTDIVDKNGKPLLSWRVALLPYMEQDTLYKQFKLDEPWDSEHNKKASQSVVKLFQNGTEPKDAKFPVTCYQRPAGAGTANEAGKKLRLFDVLDGSSNTIFIVETSKPVEWTKPADLPFDLTKPTELRGPYANVFNFAMGDGSVRKVPGGFSADAAKQLISRAGGEVPNPKLFDGLGWKGANSDKPK